jgi:DNA-directed RNA polymerase specialized sigma24 family protein
MDDPEMEIEIERELIDAQATVKSFGEVRLRRQRAVMAARAAGWSKYRIAAVMDVKGPTVDSIIKTAKRGER